MLNWRAIVKNFLQNLMAQKTVLVTGGTGVLGAEIVRALKGSTPCFDVTANFCRNSERAEKVQTETKCRLHRADVGDEAQVTKMFETLPPLFAVVHAAGAAHDELLMRQSRAMWNDSLRVLADGAFLVARAALEKLEVGGRLVFLASRAGEQGSSGQSAYASSKAAMLALMKCAALEGAQRQIAVNAICPGFVPSEMSDHLSAAQKEKARAKSVFGQFGKASETAALVQWLLSEAAAGISGQVFHCDSRLSN